MVEFLDIEGEGDQWIEDACQLNFGRPEFLPLWRVRITRSLSEGKDGKVRFRVGVFFHHGIGDGVSGGAFHISFRDALNALLVKTNEMDTLVSLEDEIVFSPTLELLPNLE